MSERGQKIPFGFRLTGDPMVVEIVADLVPLGGRVVGRVRLEEINGAFSKDVWRWNVEVDTDGGNSGGGYLQVPKRRRAS